MDTPLERGTGNVSPVKDDDMIPLLLLCLIMDTSVGDESALVCACEKDSLNKLDEVTDEIRR